MQSFGGDEDDRDSAVSADGSSDNEQEGQVDDLDADVDGDQDVDGDGDIEIDEDNEEHDDEDDEQDQEEPQDLFGDPSSRGLIKPAAISHGSLLSSRSETIQDSNGFGGPVLSAPTSHPNPTVLLTAPSPKESSSNLSVPVIETPKIRPEVLTASVYDIVPTIAAPHSTSINSITATPDLRWVFSGGADGYIRKFNWVETANGKAMLTVAQRHPFVDSVTKAGVLMSYWENEDTNVKPTNAEDGPILSPVYSLAVQHEGLWLLSGLESGGINLQSVRHDEGKLITCLRKHTSAVSVLNLAQDERSLLSGSWDKSVIDWDLNTGQIKRTFEGSGGQISALEIRPMSSLPVPEALGDVVVASSTLSSNNSDKPRVNGVLTNGIDYGVDTDPQSTGDNANEAGSPTDSLFGGNDADSLFGDNEDGEAGAPSGGNFVDDDDDEFSKAVANGVQEQVHENAEHDVNMVDASDTTTLPLGGGNFKDGSASEQEPSNSQIATKNLSSESAVNGLPPVETATPHAEEVSPKLDVRDSSAAASADALSTAESTFLAASFNGSLCIWDKRQSRPIAKISPRNVPPWSMNACWSPNGNYVYVGRRNGTVEEYSLHKGLRGVERSLKLPNGSGPVSAVRAMPNGRHLICASYDILRLYDLEQQQTFKHSTVPFLIVPGHRTGVVSQLYIDPSCRYMISTAGNRGWEGNSTEVLLGYEIGVGK